jgi:hypothetical protein
MSLYTDRDSLMLVEKVDEIIKNADALSSQSVEPKQEKRWEIIFTVRDFVIEKKRKIYGGFALNKLIEVVAPKEKFYDDENIKSWDIDFYSPDPINDAIEISNRLHAKGFRHVSAIEAQHEETYKIFAETIDCADISYVPRNIYNKMPFKEVGGLYLTGPHFMMIDYFRVLADPMTSYFRLEKTFVRLCLMLKYYPLPRNTSSIDIIPPDRDLDIAFRTIHEFLINRESTIVVGMYPYNHLIKESGIRETKQLKRNSKDTKGKKATNQTIDYLDINYYEIISIDYKKDARDFILKLQDKFPASNRITYQENYPFFQYFGYSINIYFDNEIICRLYHYNTKCTPFFEVPALYFKKSGYEENNGKIRIGSFAVLIMYNLINVMKARTDNDQNTKNLYYTLISHMIELKNYYFNRTKKTIFDTSLFQEFVLRCAGETMLPSTAKAVRRDRRHKAGKRYSWTYNPDNEKDRNSDNKYYFKNSSGNPINNEKNMKIQLSGSVLSSDMDSEDVIEDVMDEPVTPETIIKV